jgi:hypothetical protein
MAKVGNIYAEERKINNLQMKKRHIMYYIVGIILIIFVIGFLYFAKNNLRKNQKIDYEYVGFVELDNTPMCHNYFIFTDSNSMSRVLINDFRYEICKQNIYPMFYFNKFDYIMSVEKKIIDLEYDKKFEKENDFCSYLPEKPLKATYSDTINENVLFFYSIKDKHKYRNVCP